MSDNLPVKAKNLGIVFFSMLISLAILYSSVLFVDNTDLESNRRNAVVEMQMILDLCNELQQAAGGKIQEQKINFFRGSINGVKVLND